jgi:hypothetical protein
VSTWGMLTAILLLQFRLKVPTLGVQLVQVRITLFINLNLRNKSGNERLRAGFRTSLVPT